MEHWFLLSVDVHRVFCSPAEFLQETDQYSDWTGWRGDEQHAALNSFLKCFSHAPDHAVSVTQTCNPAINTLAAICCLGLPCWSRSPRWARVLEELDLVFVPGLVRSDWRLTLGSRSPRGVSNGTCACGTAPPVGPGTEVSRSAAGRGAPAGQWRWPAPGGPELAYGPESLSELGRSGADSKGYSI